jgi:Rrf2 family transcriptional regulator, cysteine metabolism repressor
MKLITKNTDYAIRALIYLARNPGRFAASSEISDKEGIPKHYLRVILQRLIKEKLLISKEGVTGGVMMKAEPGKVFITNVIRIFQGNVEMTECMFQKKICPERARCVIRARIKTIEKKLVAEFAGISIESLKNDLADVIAREQN